jgi:16S rRNA (guanine(966)-N(2))-methyltransferase RsmD
MRIISGNLRGLHFTAPSKLPVRPTTDLAKEALFNILHNQYDLAQCTVLDCFSGTGSISLEFASRGCQSVRSVDRHPACIAWLKSVIQKYQIPQISVYKADVFKYLQTCADKFDIIFADPPYDLPNIPQIAEIAVNQNLLTPDGILVIEHPSMLKLDHLSGYQLTKKYGYSSFSFFSNP